MAGQSHDRQIPSLDGLRGISIVLVMLAHAFPWSRLLDHGVLGVKVFFVVSGFLITRLIVGEIEQTGRLDIKLFFIRRMLRIFPAFYVYLAVVALVTSLHWLDIPVHNLVFAATYTMNYVAEGRWETGHLWSLAIEEQFYLIWPFAVLMLGLRRALSGAAVLAVIAPYALLALFLHGAGRYMLATQTFPFAFDGLAAGCVLGGCLDTFMKRPAFARAIASRWGALVPPAMLLLDGIDRHSLVYHAAGQLAITLGICYAVARYTQIRSLGARALAWRPLVWVGQRSYSLYLWQQLFLNPYHRTLLQLFPVNILCAVACADTSYRFIERPLNRLRRRYRPEVRLKADTTLKVDTTAPSAGTSAFPAATRT
jgi:peptidoglycan/LPS O-acetylase OafA/YrhL